MPTYDYLCKGCGHAFERFESITAKPDKGCPKCKKKKAERQIGVGGGFLFKGSGFYVTDYRKGAAPVESKPAACKSPDACTGPCAETKKTETKSEPKSESKSESKGKSPTKVA